MKEPESNPTPEPSDLDQLVGLQELERRLSRKIEGGKAITLSVAELNLLVLSGAFETLSVAAATYLRAQTERRIVTWQVEAQRSLLSSPSIPSTKRHMTEEQSRAYIAAHTSRA